MSKAHKGYMPSNLEELKRMLVGNKYCIGREPWNKGKVGVLRGKKNPNWKGGKTPKDKALRAQFRNTIQQNVFRRDNYTCQICEQSGGYLQVDHIKGWADFPELRFEMDNCRTLCMACHYYVTFKRKLPFGVIWGHNFNRGMSK